MNELQPGHLVSIAPAVQRVVAPNPSMMTGPGTNTYLIGNPPTAVIDPGPAHPSHLQAIRTAAPGLTSVFLTHHHPDHSDGVAALLAATGAERVEPERADQLFKIGGLELRAISTPGHASDHICYFLEDDGLLFSGDHILDGVTPVIMPPDGDMTDYLNSLEHLKTYPLRAIAPGHGRVLSDPTAVIDHIIAHRLRREAKVLGALRAAGTATLDQLLPRVYDDVKPELLRWARLSLEAHLIKLERDRLARRDAGQWTACTPTSS